MLLGSSAVDVCGYTQDNLSCFRRKEQKKTVTTVLLRVYTTAPSARKLISIARGMIGVSGNTTGGKLVCCKIYTGLSSASSSVRQRSIAYR